MKKILVILVAVIGFGFVANAETMFSAKYNSTENSTMLVDKSILSEDEEYEYTVEVAYKSGGNQKTVTYTIWAKSAEEAGKVAVERCKHEKGEVASCGAPIATGRKRGE